MEPEHRRRAPIAAVIATGDELIRGTTLDTNSAAIARRLAAIGWEVRSMLVLGDDEADVAAAIRRLAADHDAILVTGGLGPTLDDITRHAAARAAGVELVLDVACLDRLRALFVERGRPFLAANERQALFPAGSVVLPNPVGTAPGFALSIGRAVLTALPGPPREMELMLEREVLPRLTLHRPDSGAIVERHLYLFGLPESAFAEGAGEWMRRDQDPLIGVTAHEGVLTVTVRALGSAPGEQDLPREPRATERLVDERTAALARRFADFVFSQSEPDLARVLAAELLARRATVTVAESCTGGLLAGRLTSVPGISAVFDRAWVTYSNAAKAVELGLDPGLIERYGAVSSEVARAMSLAAAARSGARLSLSITGIAGPDGGTESKPVGLVWFGVALDGDVHTEERRLVVRERALIRAFAVNTALDLALRALRGPPSARRD